jgi:hypothetical protein
MARQGTDHGPLRVQTWPKLGPYGGFLTSSFFFLTFLLLLESNMGGCPMKTYDMGPTTPVPEINLEDSLECQVEQVVGWFFENFEDPVNSTPWDEGEYVYIWGGPYYASEELDAAFHGQVPTEVIDLAVREIGGELPKLRAADAVTL